MIPAGTIGDITWRRIIKAEGLELETGFPLPGAPTAAIDSCRYWIKPCFPEPGTNEPVMATRSCLLKTKRRNILADCYVGNDKERRRGRGSQAPDTSTICRVVGRRYRFRHLHPDHVG